MTKSIFLWMMRLLVIGGVILSVYGVARLYFRMTDGFSVGNISSDFSYQPQWVVRPLNPSEKRESERALNQSYHYFGKGCQSYVFLSEDGKYVIKFFKYQRFRLQPWENYFPESYRQAKLNKKWEKLNLFVTSWKVAFDNLKDASGLVLVHLNKTKNLRKQLVIFDKLNLEHHLNLDQMEFCLQRKAESLSDVLINYKERGELNRAELLVNELINLILSEYRRGIADNDHALLQNTGVVDEHPIHIDIGQFMLNDKFKDPSFYHQDLFTRTYRLNLWLQANYPELSPYLEAKLSTIIGPSYSTMKPHFHGHWEVIMPSTH